MTRQKRLEWSVGIAGTLIVIGSIACRIHTSPEPEAEPEPPKPDPALSSPDPWARMTAVDEANRLEDILPLLDDPEYAVRQQVVRNLPRLDPDGTKAIPILTNALKDKKSWGEVAIVAALGTYGHKAKDALPYIRQVFPDNEQVKAVIARIENGD